jgi:uncharacterized protein (TIGR02284 family)
MYTTQEQTHQLNSMLRGELSATETYQQALGKVGTDPRATELKLIHVEHREAANRLRQMVHEFGGEPDHDSGGWGLFAKAVEGTAKLFGDAAALKALKEGEEHGLKVYQDALEDPDLGPEIQDYVRTTLLPQTRAHIAALDRLMARK